MYIRSTGLGKTLLKAKVAKIEPTNIIPSTMENPNGSNEPTRLLMVADIIEPVNWTVRIFVEPHDLRQMLKQVLMHPSNLLRALGFLFAKEGASARPEVQEENS